MEGNTPRAAFENVKSRFARKTWDHKKENGFARWKLVVDGLWLGRLQRLDVGHDLPELRIRQLGP